MERSGPPDAHEGRASDDALEPGVRTDFEGALTYGGYLALPELLACQRPVSRSHDELLFIVIHQATELWLKLMVHELRAARERIRADDLGPSFKMLARVSRIQEQLIRSWDVLSTLTPADYLTFRPLLGPASGFQSFRRVRRAGRGRTGEIRRTRRKPRLRLQIRADRLPARRREGCASRSHRHRPGDDASPPAPRC